MLNIDVLTMGSEFKDNSGEIYAVTSNFGEDGKIMLVLEKVVPQFEEKMIDED